ncbi:glycosyltransferase [Algoriphagus yeomjeoni]|uniref:Glycosyltransferase involved in cell wall biosynthesis n=1 Tax=Algoriphagus yeomjeoni TaxID=291403 RepID=A0A327P6P3_9BACT|nr:glycosyltransferase [Algoriphagus yeomjeoni]RAI85596.1 glycosyltransferase involved in cell wall biosynthesis [Algoriphagus yeomjeoni]
MKIFQVIQKPQARGVELFTCLLSEELQKRGHEVTLISIFEGEYHLPYSGKQIHLKRPLANRLVDWKAWKAFAKLVEEEVPDIIQANAADTLKFTVFSKKLFGWKVPIIFRNASQVSLYIKNPWTRRFNEFLYGSVVGIASVSKKSADDFGLVFNFEKLHKVIPIGINIPNKISNEPILENPILVHIGGFTFEKNHSELIDMYGNISKSFPNLTLWLLGDGPLKEKVTQKIHKLDLQSSVVFKGNVADPFQSIPPNSILLLPSKIEGIPAVILEAFANRIPVIAYDVGGISEVLTKETGWLIPPGDQNAFISAVQEVLQMDQTEKATILDQAFKLVSDKYSIEKISKQFETFYLEVIL